MTLLPVMKWREEGNEDEKYGLALAVNDRGEVVWYYRRDEMIEDPHPLPNDNLLCLLGNNRAELLPGGRYPAWKAHGGGEKGQTT